MAVELVNPWSLSQVNNLKFEPVFQAGKNHESKIEDPKYYFDRDSLNSVDLACLELSVQSEFSTY